MGLGVNELFSTPGIPVSDDFIAKNSQVITKEFLCIRIDK